MVAASQPYDQRDGYIWMNGELISWRDARVHLLTHALHYGSAVFEGERVYDGEIFKLTEHSQRLHESAKGLDFVIPVFCRRDRPRLPRCGAGEQVGGWLCAPACLARQRADGRRGAGD